MYKLISPNDENNRVYLYNDENDLDAIAEKEIVQPGRYNFGIMALNQNTMDIYVLQADGTWVVMGEGGDM